MHQNKMESDRSNNVESTPVTLADIYKELRKGEMIYFDVRVTVYSHRIFSLNYTSEMCI